MAELLTDPRPALQTGPILQDPEISARGVAGLPTTLGQAIGATAEETWARNPAVGLYRWGERALATGGFTNPGGVPDTILSEEDANAQYGITGHLKFDNALPASVAHQLNASKLDELARKNVQERYDGGLLGSTALLGVGLAVSAADPLNIASAFIPFVGPARYARSLELAGEAAAAGGRSAMLARTAVRARVGAIEGGAGAAVLEPLNLYLAHDEQADYTSVDSLLNVAFGTVLGGGLHAGFGAVRDAVRGIPRAASEAPALSREIDALPLEGKQQLLNTAIADFVDTGTVRNASDVLEGLRGERAVPDMLAARADETAIGRGAFGPAGDRGIGESSRIVRGTGVKIPLEEEAIARAGAALPDKPGPAIAQAGDPTGARAQAAVEALKDVAAITPELREAVKATAAQLKPEEPAAARAAQPPEKSAGELLGQLGAARSKPFEFYRQTVRPEDLLVDAKRFQFKGGADQQGVTGRLKGVTRWEPLLAGETLVWQDKSGRKFVADGHQRHALALALKDQNPRLEAVILREEDGITDKAAMVIAALRNIAQGTGSAVDAAKVLRLIERNANLAAELPALPQLPPSSQLVQDARALSRLDDEAFGMVVNGLVPPNQAAWAGRLFTDKLEQRAAIAVLAKTKPATTTEARFILEQMREAGFEKQFQQGGLFGDRELAASFMVERAKLLEGALKQLRRDQRVFRTLIDEEGRITDAGNALKNTANVERLTDDEKLIVAIATLGTRKGAISETLGQRARELRSGGKLNAVARGFIDDVRSRIRQGLDLGAIARGTGPDTAGGAAGRIAPPADPQKADLLAEIQAGTSPTKLLEHPAVQEARARSLAIPLTTEQPGYGTPEWFASRKFNVAGKEHVGYDAGVTALYDDAGQWSNGPVLKERNAVFVIGPPAAGKSRIAETIAAQRHARVIDSDEAKKALPEYAGGDGANATHEESSAIARVVQQRAVAAGDNIVVPRIGADPVKLEQWIAELKAAGYTVELHLMKVDPDEALRRMLLRFVKTNRLINLEFVRAIGDRPEQAYIHLKSRNAADAFTIHDNNAKREPAGSGAGEADRADARDGGRRGVPGDGGPGSEAQGGRPGAADRAGEPGRDRSSPAGGAREGLPLDTAPAARPAEDLFAAGDRARGDVAAEPKPDPYAELDPDTAAVMRAADDAIERADGEQRALFQTADCISRNG